MDIALVYGSPNGFQCIMSTQMWSKSITAVQKICFKNGFEHLLCGCLDNTVSNRRDTERPLASVWFGDIDSFQRFRSVVTRLEGLLDISENSVFALFKDISYTFVVYTGFTSIGFYLLPCILKGVHSVHLIVECMETSGLTFLGCKI